MIQIFEGFKLMIVGMSIVYVFLILLMVSIFISSKIFKASEQTAAPVSPPVKKDSGDLVAVISAAISEYRVRKSK